MALRHEIGVVRDPDTSDQRSDRGAAMITAMLFMVLLSGLSLLLLGVMLGQATTAQQAQKHGHTGYAAQAGLQAALNTIRSIDKTSAKGVYGDRTKLPCALTGRVDGATSDLTYDVKVEYFSTDPTYQSASWRAANRYTCASGVGVNPQPAFAVVQSRGIGPDITGQPAGTGNRGVAAVYSFKLTNVNIPGGLLRTSTSGFCVRASGAVVGATLSFVPVANCTKPELDNWVYNTDIEFELASSESITYPGGLCITMGALAGASYPTSLQPCLPNTDPARWVQLYSAFGGTTLWGQKQVISAGRSNVCLSHSNLYSGGALVVSSSNCNGWSPEFKVGAGAAGKPTSQVVNFGEFGRCMDVTDENPNRAFMIVYPCKQDPTGTGSGLNWNHQFFYNEPSTLEGSINTTIEVVPYKVEANRRCLETPLSTSSSNYPIIVTCTGSARQSWVRTAASPAGYAQSWVFIDTYGRCITALQTDLYGGWISKMGVVNCDSSSIQKWNAPPFQSESTLGGFKEIAG